MPRVGAVLVAAGASTRAGPGVPKQFRRLDTRPVFVAALEPLLRHCDEIVVVVPAGEEERAALLLSRCGLPSSRVAPDRADGNARVAVVAGGPRRQDSVGEGLRALSGETEVVLVHDAARPFAAEAVVERVIEAALEHGAAVPVVPVSDTVKRVEEGLVVATLDRSVLALAQTPQGFRREVLVSARREIGDADVTDDAQCVELAGQPVAVVEGDPSNLKLTDARDLELAALLGASRLGLDADARVGIGSDCHRLVEGRRLVLCGVEVPFGRGLDGWSDADAATHAVMDALLGAAGERDVGHHFPPGDERYERADSTSLLREVVDLLRREGFCVGSVDLTVTAEAPRLSPFIDDMRRTLAEALGVGSDRVSVKATTTEGTGPEGAGEAISATAVAVVRRRGEDDV
ncbi:MAG: 2-C-methyl-D-erythritol 4-phosphate cytidylyltransferase [Candidatus Eisenbacteria bacterium]|nr:2-C-methyl-D-erythritol 4-phosphate cytidylyltransferase [Candidatus Eisenbacteria bacterium]